MKKATIIACACALFMGLAADAQEATQELQYQPDPSQGVLLNRMKDNWFITLEGGASFYVAKNGVHRAVADRFMPAASLYAGKWFSPVFGGRIGFSYLGLKGLSSESYACGAMPEMVNGYYKTKYAEIGPVADLMINLTNWWCGYKPVVFTMLHFMVVPVCTTPLPVTTTHRARVKVSKAHTTTLSTCVSALSTRSASASRCSSHSTFVPQA